MYVHVTLCSPTVFLSHVHNTYTQEKIEKLKAKVESLEKVRDDLKESEAQLESKVSAVSSAYEHIVFVLDACHVHYHDTSTVKV